MAHEGFIRLHAPHLGTSAFLTSTPSLISKSLKTDAVGGNSHIRSTASGKYSSNLLRNSFLKASAISILKECRKIESGSPYLFSKTLMMAK
jgi:hypothetical protein